MKAKIKLPGGAVAEIEGTAEEIAQVVQAVPTPRCVCTSDFPCPLHVVRVPWQGELAWRPLKASYRFPLNAGAGNQGGYWWYQPQG